jgi:hypothetical protein
MPRTAISGLVCTTFLVLLGFPAVPQEPCGTQLPWRHSSNMSVVEGKPAVPISLP